MADKEIFSIIFRKDEVVIAFTDYTSRAIQGIMAGIIKNCIRSAVFTILLPEKEVNKQ